MTTPFRLFSLPFIPLKQVLDNFGPQGIIILSLCSLRSKSLVVSYRGPSKNVRLTLDFGLQDSLEDSDESYSKVLLKVKDTRELPMDPNPLETIRIGSFKKVAVKMGNRFEKREYLITYWDDRMTGLAAIGDYGREIFDQDIYKVRIGEKEVDDDHRRAAEWVTKSQNTIQSLHCDFKTKFDNELDFILDNFKYTHTLSLYVKPSENYIPAKLPNFQIDNLRVRNSFWIRQEQLLKMNCNIVTLRGSKLTNQDCNVFLKHWMAGGCSQLKDFWVFLQEPIDFDDVLDGVDFTEREIDLERVYVDKDGAEYTIMGSFDVKRSNITATVVDQPDVFWLIVW